jgi:serine/threonine protein kinase
VLHRDLKPGNVLLSEDLRTIKLCDFGSARALAEAATMTVGVGTMQYMAPEVLNPSDDGAVQYDAKIDVYSFGVLLWELFAASKPFAQLQAAQIPMAVCAKKARPSPDPASSPATIVALMKRCWSHEPAERPTMAAAIGPLAQALMQADEAAKQAAEASNECVVCVDAARSIALAPCGHVCSCEDCAGDLRECPICRQPIDGRLKVFQA